MKKKDILKRIEMWLKKPNNTHAKMAVALGYQSTNAITQWFYKGVVPKNRIDQIDQFLLKEKC
jgi:hypothetical protein